MKGKVRYTDEPMVSRPITDFLPRPDQLIFNEDAVKVTITLSSRSVQYFKDEAAKRGVQYQRMIRRLLDAYVDAFAPSGSESRAAQSRAEQPSAPYRKRETNAAKNVLLSDALSGLRDVRAKRVRAAKQVLAKYSARGKR